MDHQVIGRYSVGMQPPKERQTVTSVRVRFRLEQVDGYPPVAVESIWTQEVVGDSGYLVDSIPFFTTDATLGDRIAARTEDGELWFDRVLERSGNSLLRVVLFDEERMEDVRLTLRAFGCSVETLASRALLAVNVPANVAMAEVREYLVSLTATGVADYEEPILRQ